jgi:hypothetical protein
VLTTIVLTLLYPLLLLARLLNTALGRDPLRSREGDAASFWIARTAEPDQASYFSEASAAEGRGHGGMGRLAMPVFLWLAGRYAPGREQPREKFSASADREQGIPDELYTLW